MARAENTDYMQSFRFHVVAVDNASLLEFTNADELPGGQAGFNAVSIPDTSVDVVEYREGTLTYTRKQPGIPTVGESTMSRGIVRRDTTFHDWITAVVEGGEYRTDLLVFHYHRDEPRLVAEGVSGLATRKYVFKNCFASMAKVAGDLDATSGDISLAELTVACEKVEVDLD